MSRGPLKRDLLGIYLRTSLVVFNLRNTEAMRVIFFWKCLKFNANSKNAANNWEKTFCLWNKCIWLVCIQLSLLIREYLSAANNVLRKPLKKFHVPKSDFYNSITFTVITQDDKGALIKIESVPCSIYHVVCRWFSQTGPFRLLSKHVFRCR